MNKFSCFVPAYLSRHHEQQCVTGYIERYAEEEVAAALIELQAEPMLFSLFLCRNDAKLEQALNEGKPEKIVDKMVEGRIAKFYENYCLLEQPFVKDGDKKVIDILNSLIATIGEKITVRRFVRYEKGEGLAKKEENFAEEVQKQLQ